MVEAERAARRWRAAAAALVIIAVALVQVALVWTVLNPRTFFAGDAGVRYLQVDNILASGWQSSQLRNPAARIDPDYRFTVFTGPHFLRRAHDAPYYGTYGDLFNVLAAASFELLGPRGLYLIPILGNVGAMWLAYLMARRWAPRSAWLAPLLVGACSPMFFYGLDLWEHTLAAMLATAAVFAISGPQPLPLSRCALAGVALAGSIAAREELYAFAPALLIGVAWIERRRRLPAALTMAVSAGLALLPYWWLKWAQTGAPVRHAVNRLLSATTGISGIGVPASKMDASAIAWDTSIVLVAPFVAVWLVPLAAAAALRWALPRLQGRWQPPALAALAMIVVGWAWADLALMWHFWQRPNGLLQVFPVALFLLFAPPALPPGTLRTALLELLTIAAVYLALSMVAGPFAVREAPIGGAQYGPRLIMPVFPLLAVCIVLVLERRDAWSPRVAFAPGLLAGTLALLVTATLLLQVHGVRELRGAKASYEQLVQATEQLTRDSVVATDLWWYPQVAAAVLYERQTVRVEFSPESALPHLLQRLRGDSAQTLTLVSARGELGERHAPVLAEEHWRETGRLRVPSWTDVHLVSYQRQTGANGS